MMYTQNEILNKVANIGKEKVDKPFKIILLAGFLTSFLAGVGYLGWYRYIYLYISTGNASGSINVAGFLEAFLYPIGACLAIWGGSEMILSSALYVTSAYLLKKVTFFDMIKNFALVFASNILGVLFSSFVFGHLAQLMEKDLLKRTIAIAVEKINMPLHVAFIAGMACNIIFLIGLWYYNSTDKTFSKFVYIWLFVVLYFILGAQHTITNIFTISAAVFTGESGISVLDFIKNILAVFTGNMLGGIFFVTIPYFVFYKQPIKK